MDTNRRGEKVEIRLFGHSGSACEGSNPSPPECITFCIDAIDW